MKTLIQHASFVIEAGGQAADHMTFGVIAKVKMRKPDGLRHCDWYYK